MTVTIKNILVITAAWLLLYVLAVFSVHWALKYGASRYWATPVWVFLYFIPGLIAGRLLHKNWVLGGVAVGIIGSAAWLVHAQMLSINLGTTVNIIANTAVCLFGAWVGQRNIGEANAL